MTAGRTDRARWALGLALLSAVAVALAVVLHRYNVPRAHVPAGLPAPVGGGTRRDLVRMELTEPMLGVLFPFVGWLVLRRSPGNRIGYVCLSAALIGVKILCGEYAVTAYLVSPGLPLGALAAWITEWGWTPYLLLMTLLPLIYPDGRLLSPRWRWAARASVGACGWTALTLSLARAPLDSSDFIDNPLGLSAPWLQPLVALGVGVAFLIVGPAAVVSLVLRQRRARGRERARVLWGLVGAGFLVATQLMMLVVKGILADVFSVAGFVAVAVAIVVGTTFYGDARRDLVLNRTLVYAMLTALALALYGVAVALVDGVVPGSNVGPWAIAVVALLAVVARDAVQRGVDRWLYGDRRDPYAVVTRAGGRLDVAAGPLDALASLVRELAAALKSPYVAVIPDDPDLPPALTGERGDHVETVPIVIVGRRVGRLEVGYRHERERFRGDEQALLAELAVRAGTLLYAASLVADLQRSRERIVVAREEERRRLRHDLHDGLGPQLAGMALQLDSLVGRLEPGSEAERRVQVMRDRMRQMVAEVRGVVDNLRPAALDQLGLVEALREHARAVSPVAAAVGGGLTPADKPGLQVDVVAGPLPPLPAAVEVAAYRIATEAVTNVLRHSDARRCQVSLHAAASLLTVEVADDGSGMTDELRPGIGLQSMRERAAELGGEFAVTTGSAGTLVTARLPLEVR
ncbi:MAG: sensor histidine kinase [Actinomycetales bacterium]